MDELIIISSGKSKNFTLNLAGHALMLTTTVGSEINILYDVQSSS